MNMKCDYCGHTQFLLDYDAVKKIDSAAKVISINIADPCGEAVYCAGCFQTSITDTDTGKKINWSSDLLREVFQRAGSSQAILPFPSGKLEGFVKTDVFIGHICDGDLSRSVEVRENVIGILADQSSMRIQEAVTAVLTNLTPELLVVSGQKGTGVSIRLTVTAHPETDATFHSKPDLKTPCYTVIPD